MWERVALVERLLCEVRCDEAAIAQARVLLQQAESLAEWEPGARSGAGPCMRVAPWKGSGYDGD
jgi:hypothetical protein